jgi:hypothetical protein
LSGGGDSRRIIGGILHPAAILHGKGHGLARGVPRRETDAARCVIFK